METDAATSMISQIIGETYPSEIVYHDDVKTREDNVDHDAQRRRKRPLLLPLVEEDDLSVKLECDRIVNCLGELAGNNSEERLPSVIVPPPVQSFSSSGIGFQDAFQKHLCKTVPEAKVLGKFPLELDPNAMPRQQLHNNSYKLPTNFAQPR